MLSWLNKQEHILLSTTTWLNDEELQALHLESEQIDCTATPNIKPTSQQAGSLSTRVIGSGSDYAESRVYQPGDDPRSINWRLSARSTETFVKTFHIESRPGFSLLLDKRRGMLFGTKSRLKITQAVRAATLLTYASENHQVSFQAWIITDKHVKYFDNAAGFLLEANKCIPSFTESKKSKLDIKTILPNVIHDISEGSLVSLISDLDGFTNSKVQADLAMLGEKAFIQAFHVIDQAEINLSHLGKIQFQEIHGNKRYSLNTDNEKDRMKFLQQAENIINNRKALITNLGLSYTSLFTDCETVSTEISLPLGKQS